MNTVIRHVTPADLDRCYTIETLAYEGDEAATREKIATRITTWPEGFIVAEVDGVVAGFINSGAAFEVEMSDEAFKELIGHDPASRASRRAALQALIVTTLGGLAMLVGIVMLGEHAGSYRWSQVASELPSKNFRQANGAVAIGLNVPFTLRRI